MFIVNGRIGNDAQVGRPACKNVSVVDYFICTPNQFSPIVNFEVDGFNPMYASCQTTAEFKSN